MQHQDHVISDQTSVVHGTRKQTYCWSAATMVKPKWLGYCERKTVYFHIPQTPLFHGL